MINSQEIERLALWVMNQYEQSDIRKMYAALKKEDPEDFKGYSNAFFHWLICLTSEKKDVRGEIISTINKIRAEQRARLREAVAHENELTSGLPDNDL